MRSHLSPWGRVVGLGAVAVATLACPATEASPGTDEPSAASEASSAPATPTASATSLWSRTDGHDWPTFLGPTRDGVSTETGIRTDWSDGLPVVWHHEMGEGYSAPSVADGRVFVFDRVGDEERLSTRHAETGELLWQRGYPTAYEDYYDFSTGPRASPVVVGDEVYTYGVEGWLRSHRVTDGELLWEVDVNERFGVEKNFFGVGSTPVVEGDLLIAMVGGSPPDSPRIHSGDVRPNGSAVVAFDRSTGEVVWSAGDELASYASIQLATVGEKRLGFAFARGGLLAFEPATGAIGFHVPWRSKKLESVNAATPVVVGDRVAITESYGPGGAVLAVRPEGYDVVWQDGRRDQSLDCHWSTPIHHDGVLYASTGQSTGQAELRAVELETGKVRWRQPRLKRATLLSVDGHFVVLSEDGTLRLVARDPDAYRLVAELTPKDDAGRPLLRSPAWNAPVLAHGLLFVRGKDRIAALELIPE